MAYVEDMGNNKHKIYVDMGYVRGKRVRRTKTVTVTSNRDLNKKIKNFELKCMQDVDEPIDNITFSGFVEKWKDNHVKVNLTKTTEEVYQQILDAYLLDYFGKMKLKDIKKFHVVEYLAKQKAMAPNKYLTLKSIFQKAVEWDVLNVNPTANIKEPKREKKKVNFYNEDELKELFNALDDCYPKHRIMVKLAAIGGLRRGEVLGIRIESIDYKNDRLYIDKQLKYSHKEKVFYLAPVKNKKPRYVYLPKNLMEEIKAYHNLEYKRMKLALGNLWKGIYDNNNEMINLLFVKEDGYPAMPNSLGNEWRKIIKRHDLKKITFHELRHSCASLMVKKGINFKVIQERLGHANIGITLDTYSHLEEEQHIESTSIFNSIL